jgi:hypothetical protein
LDGTGVKLSADGNSNDKVNGGTGGYIFVKTYNVKNPNTIT